MPELRLPFLLNFVGEIDSARFDQAMSNMTSLAELYDPVTQTSLFEMSAGTEATWKRTGFFLDDREMDDT